MFLEREDERKAKNGVAMHKAAMLTTGRLNHDLLDHMRDNMPEGSIIQADVESGQYVGSVLWSNQHTMVQSLGRGNVTIHRLDQGADKQFATGDLLTVRYRDGAQLIQKKDRDRERGPSL